VKWQTSHLITAVRVLVKPGRGLLGAAEVSWWASRGAAGSGRSWGPPHYSPALGPPAAAGGTETEIGTSSPPSGTWKNAKAKIA
jgi:hypothetical protein